MDDKTLIDAAEKPAITEADRFLNWNIPIVIRILQIEGISAGIS